MMTTSSVSGVYPMTGRATETSAFRGSDFDDVGRIASSGGSNILILAGFGFEIIRKHPRNPAHRNQFVYTNLPYLSLHHGLAGHAITAETGPRAEHRGRQHHTRTGIAE